MTVGPAFLDTNVLLRHILDDSPNHSPAATSFFQRIARGELTARISDTVVFETVFTLEKHYRISRKLIAEAIWSLLNLKGLALPGKQHYRTVFDLFEAQRRLSFVDCYHAVLMKRLKLTEIVSFDRGFDRLPDITRTEPY